jgi:hypothetical protein
MRRGTTVILLAPFLTLALGAPAAAQKRVGPKGELAFGDAVAAAQKAVEAGELGSAISALQAAIRDLQKQQRAAILAALPKPEGWQVEDQPAAEAEAVAAGLALAGLTVQRHYTKDGQRLDVEVTANSPFLQMMAMMFANPALIAAEGGERVEYGQHKAILKAVGDSGAELQILMHDKHIIKVASQGVGGDELLEIFNQAFVDQMEKPLGK